MSNSRVLISGCSEGGKSTLLAELARRGFATVDEPGRRIVRAQTDPNSPLLPWNEPVRFAEAAMALARSDLAAHAGAQGPVFFDRRGLDAALAHGHAAGAPIPDGLAGRYDPQVFMAPP